MGQTPSTSAKPGTPASANNPTTAPTSTQDFSPRQSKRDSKNFPIHTAPRVAAPPEPSQVQAHGQTSAASSRHGGPKSAISANIGAASSSPSSNSSSSAAVAVPPRPVSVPLPRHELSGSRPVDVPHHPAAAGEHHPYHTTPSSAGQRGLSHAQAQAQAALRNSGAVGTTAYGAHAVDAGSLLAHGSINDMSYLTRPPRLPLPIDEEIHTPGSPINNPSTAETPDPLDDHEVVLEALGNDEGITRLSSGISSTTMDEEEVEELPIDHSSPTIPTRLEWNRGGEKVYVTGTIFQWNRKQRLHLM